MAKTRCAHARVVKDRPPEREPVQSRSRGGTVAVMSEQNPASPEPTEPARQSPESVAPEPSGGEPVAAAPMPAPSYPPPPWPPPAYPAAAAPPPAAPPGYPSSYPAAPAYPAAPPGAQPGTSSNAIVALVLAIISWVVCPIVPAIVALIFANMADKEIQASGDSVQGKGLVTASKIVSWINIGLWAAMIVIGAFVLVIVAIAGGMSSGTKA